MVGKSYKTVSEAFKDAEYASAIERPQEGEYDIFWGFLGAMAFLGVFAYSFWITIGRYA
jgi:hypothetical protein